MFLDAFSIQGNMIIVCQPVIVAGLDDVVFIAFGEDCNLAELSIPFIDITIRLEEWRYPAKYRSGRSPPFEGLYLL